MAIKKKSLIGAPVEKKTADGDSKNPVHPAKAKKLAVAKLATAKLSTAKLATLRKFS